MITFKKTIDELAQRRRDRLEADIEAARRRLDKDLQELRENYKLLQEMAPVVGDLVNKSIESPWDVYLTLKVKQEDLPALRQALGAPLVVEFKGEGNTREETVNVYIKCERFPQVRFYYESTIEEGDPCRYEEQVTRRKVLVCERQEMNSDD